MRRLSLQRYCLLLPILSLAAVQPAMAEVYKWMDAQGNIHFSDKKSAAPDARLVPLQSSLNRYHRGELPAFHPRRESHAPPTLHPGQVVMYSTSWCGYCKQARAYFEQKGIAYADRDIEKSAQAQREYQALGGGGIPLILVGNKSGTRKISGFSRAGLDAVFR